MADKKRLLDVWIVGINMVYREVPFAVVTDWLQQGRLLVDIGQRRLAARNANPTALRIKVFGSGTLSAVIA